MREVRIDCVSGGRLVNRHDIVPYDIVPYDIVPYAPEKGLGGGAVV